MPEVCRFYGIVIYIYHSDHGPAHFHARYDEFEVVIEIETMRIIAGRFPNRATKLVNEWANMYKSELMENWNLAQSKEALKAIQPLE